MQRTESLAERGQNIAKMVSHDEMEQRDDCGLEESDATATGSATSRRVRSLLITSAAPIPSAAYTPAMPVSAGLGLSPISKAPYGVQEALHKVAHTITRRSAICAAATPAEDWKGRILSWFQQEFAALVQLMRECPLGTGPGGGGNPYHAENTLWTHSLLTLYALPADAQPNAMLAALLHDVGKIYTTKRALLASTCGGPDAVHAYHTPWQRSVHLRTVRRNSGRHHDRVGAVIASCVIDALKTTGSLQPIQHLISKPWVVKLVAWHMDIDLHRSRYGAHTGFALSKLYALWTKYAAENGGFVKDMLDLNMADCHGRFGIVQHPREDDVLHIIHQSLLSTEFHRYRVHLSVHRAEVASEIDAPGSPVPTAPDAPSQPVVRQRRPRCVCLTSLAQDHAMRWYNRHRPGSIYFPCSNQTPLTQHASGSANSSTEPTVGANAAAMMLEKLREALESRKTIVLDVVRLDERGIYWKAIGLVRQYNACCDQVEPRETAAECGSTMCRRVNEEGLSPYILEAVVLMPLNVRDIYHLDSRGYVDYASIRSAVYHYIILGQEVVDTLSFC